MEQIWNKINNNLKIVGQDVEDFEYKIIFDGVMWTCEVNGTSLDGEEQSFNFEGIDLNDLYKEIINEFGDFK